MDLFKLWHGAIAGACGLLLVVPAMGTTVRVVSYNLDSYDIGNDNNITASYAGLPSVIQAIGNHHLGTSAQPVDVLGIEELGPNTASSLTGALNGIYGANTYSYATTADPTTGGGVDGLVYNAKTIQLMSGVAIGTVSTAGASRAPLRYLMRPIGYSSGAADFYMYVSHYKAGSDSASVTRRGVEAAEIRADAATLGPNAHIIFSGDYNATSASSDPSYTTLTATGTDNARAYDVTAPATNYVSNFTNGSSSFKYLYSESTNSLNSRFDMELISGAMLNQPGLQIATDAADPITGGYPSSIYPYSYEAFGNNGTTTVGTITNNYPTNTSLNDLTNPGTILADLMQPYAGNNNQAVGSDHLPIVADFVVSVPEHSTIGLIGVIVLSIGGRARKAKQRFPT